MRHTSTQKISLGRMHEAIPVAMNNSRVAKCCTPGNMVMADSDIGDAYMDLRASTDGRLYVDMSFRPLNDQLNTTAAGSSMGGLTSA